MAGVKVSALPSLTGAATATNDLVPVLDVSDTTLAASGSDKSLTVPELARAVALDGRLIFNAAATPATPAADTMAIFGRKIANRMLPAFIGPSGLDSALQPSLARNKIAFVNARGNSTVLDSVGLLLTTGAGTVTLAAVSTTNIHTWARRADYLVTVAATTAVAGWRHATPQWGRGNAAGLGGFHYVCRWGPATGVATTTNRAFVGLSSSLSAPTDVEPSSLLNQMGMGWDAADTNIQFMTNDGTGTCTKTDLGASFPVPTTDRTNLYEIALFCPPNGTTVYYEVTDIGSGAVATGSVTTDYPANTTLLGPRGYISVGGTSSVIGIALCSIYIETDQ